MTVLAEQRQQLIEEKKRELAERHREIMAAQQRELAELEGQIRRQRLDDLQDISARLTAAEREANDLRQALTRDDLSRRVKETHQRWSELQDSLDTQEPWLAVIRSYNNRIHPDEIPQIVALHDAYTTRRREMLYAERRAYADYHAAIEAKVQRDADFADHPIHAKIARLRRLQDEAVAALNEPI